MNVLVLHYLALIVLVFSSLVLGVLLAGRVFLYVLSSEEENIAAAICAALLAVICVVLAVVLLIVLIQWVQTFGAGRVFMQLL